MRPPARQARRPSLELLGDREAHARRDLLRLAEILVRRLLEALALERDHALVAAALRARIDGHGQDARPRSSAVFCAPGPSAATAPGVEARRGAKAVRRIEIDHDHLDRPVGFRLS